MQGQISTSALLKVELLINIRAKILYFKADHAMSYISETFTFQDEDASMKVTNRSDLSILGYSVIRRI